MNVFFARTFFLLFLALLQVSFFNVLFPSVSSIPFLLFSFAISVTLLLGFDQAIAQVIALGVFVDLFESGHLGMWVFYAVGIAYTASFFSRRFLFEHRILLVVFSAALSGAMGLFSVLFSQVVLSDAGLFESVARTLSWHRAFFFFGFGMVFFLGVSPLVAAFENRMRYGELDAKLKW